MTAPRTTGPLALAELRAEAARVVRDGLHLKARADGHVTRAEGVALEAAAEPLARLALGVLELARSAQREGVVAVLRAAKAGAR